LIEEDWNPSDKESTETNRLMDLLEEMYQIELLTNDTLGQRLHKIEYKYNYKKQEHANLVRNRSVKKENKNRIAQRHNNEST